MNAGNLAVVDEVLAPDLAFHGIRTTHGVEPFKQFVTLVRTAQGPVCVSVSRRSIFPQANLVVAATLIVVERQKLFRLGIFENIGKGPIAVIALVETRVNAPDGLFYQGAP